MIGLREDRQMRAKMVDMLNHTVAACRRERAVASKLACAGGRSAPKKPGSAAQTAGASSLATVGPVSRELAVGFRRGAGVAAQAAGASFLATVGPVSRELAVGFRRGAGVAA